jgi:hypothetical protein
MSKVNCMYAIKLICALLIVGALSASSVLAGQAIFGLQSDLVLYLPMDEAGGEWAEDFALDNNGHLKGNADWADGKSGGAISFDGFKDYIDCGNDPSLNPGTGSWTVEVWFRTSGGRQGLVAKDDNCGGDGYFFDIYDGGKLHFLVRDAAGPDTVSGTTLGLNDGEWHHAVAVRNVEEDKLYLYLDGNQDGEASILNTSGSDVTPSANCYLGNLIRPGSGDFNGQLDEVRIYNKALSEQDVLERYEDATTVTYTGMVSGRYSDPVALTATLIDEQGNAVPNKRIEFKVGEQTASASTNSDGVAEECISLYQEPGAYTVEASFAGEGCHLKSEDSRAFEIEKETPALYDADHEADRWTWRVAYFGYATINITMLDNDGATLLHQEDQPKTVYMEYRNGTDWVYVAEDALSSAGNDDTALAYTFEVRQWEDVGLSGGDWPIRFRFDGDDYYDGVVQNGTISVKSARDSLIDEANSIKQYVQDLADGAFRKNPDQLRNALTQKLAVLAKITESEGYRGASSKLLHDIRPKVDGEPAPQDWVTAGDAQQTLTSMIDELMGHFEAVT